MALSRSLVSTLQLLNCDVHQTGDIFLSHTLAKAIIEKPIICFLKQSTITRSPKAHHGYTDRIKNPLKQSHTQNASKGKRFLSKCANLFFFLMYFILILRALILFVHLFVCFSIIGSHKCNLPMIENNF